MLVASILTLTILFLSAYYILTHQIMYFGTDIVIVSPSTIIVVYVLLLTGILLRGKAKFLRPFPVAIALYLIANTIIFNLQRFYPIVLNTYYLFALLIGIAIVSSDLPKRHITSSIGFTIIAIASYLLLVKYTPFFALIAAAVMIYLAFTSLASGFEGEIAKGVLASRTYVILALTAIIVLEFLKPYLHGGLFDIAEWVILILVVFASVRKIKVDFDANYLTQHRQSVSEKFDELILNLDTASELFVLHGEKSLLVSSILKALFDAGYSEKDAAELVNPLVLYCEERPPLLLFPWEKSLIKRKNVSRRKKVLKKVMEQLDRIKNI